MNINNLRSEFPQLEQKVYGKPLVYLDNAATSLRPRSVIDKWNEMATIYNSNLHRAVHYCANKATDEYENTRDIVKDFINAKHREEIIFTSGATASINLVASCYNFYNGDEIIVSQAEHHSNIVPWQFAAERSGAKIVMFHVDNDGSYDLEKLKTLINNNTKLLAITHISNVLGLLNPIKEIVNICHSKNCKVLIDGSQAIVHTRINVQDLDCDFYVFSGHKMYAATGTGVLYTKREILEDMHPYMGGGEMVGNVSFDKTTYAPLPLKFEAGTQNFLNIPTLKPAIKLLKEQINTNEDLLVNYLKNELNKIEGLHIYGTNGKKIPLFSFHVKQVHHEDLALILDKYGIATRSGQMCAEPLMDRFRVSGMLRVSFLAYNTIEEAEYFIESLKKAINLCR